MGTRTDIRLTNHQYEAFREVRPSSVDDSGTGGGGATGGAIGGGGPGRDGREAPIVWKWDYNTDTKRDVTDPKGLGEMLRALHAKKAFALNPRFRCAVVR